MKHESAGLIVDHEPILTAAEREAYARARKVIDLAAVRRQRERAAFLKQWTRPMPTFPGAA